MKKFLTTILLLAALTALFLTGCGNNNTPDSSIAEINKFGVTVNPSAVPSTGEMAPESSANLAFPTAKTSGKVDEHDTQTSAAPASPSPTKVPTPSYAPPVSYAPTTQPSTSPSAPLQSPPADPFGGTADEVRKYIGKTLTELVSDLGYPITSDYEPIDEDDPSAGDIGTLTFSGGYTVTTKRTSEGEVITAVTE